jgi:hypothetical protein
MRRYTTKRERDDTVTLTVTEYSCLGEEGQVRIFWVPSPQGYVREVTAARPGFMGRQVCRDLHPVGATLLSTPEGLLSLIRSEARRALRSETRAARRLRGY